MSLPTLYEKNIFEKNSFLLFFILIMRFDSYDIVTTKGLKNGNYSRKEQSCG